MTDEPANRVKSTLDRRSAIKLSGLAAVGSLAAFAGCGDETTGDEENPDEDPESEEPDEEPAQPEGDDPEDDPTEEETAQGNETEGGGFEEAEEAEENGSDS